MHQEFTLTTTAPGSRSLTLRLLSTDNERVRFAVAGALVAKYGADVWVKPVQSRTFKEWRFELVPQGDQSLSDLRNRIKDYLQDLGLTPVIILT